MVQQSIKLFIKGWAAEEDLKNEKPHWASFMHKRFMWVNSEGQLAITQKI